MVCLSIAPALGIHLLLHFGVPGYCFHYLPALIALIVLGIGRDRSGVPVPCLACGERTVRRLIGMATILAATFWFYPTDFAAPGWRGDFDMSFCRLTRNGLNEPLLRPAPYLWRTVNSSRPMEPARQASRTRTIDDERSGVCGREVAQAFQACVLPESDSVVTLLWIASRSPASPS